MPERTIPVRRLGSKRTVLRFAEEFNIRRIEEVLGNTDMVQDLHRHDHYFLMAVTKGKGVHICDFTPHVIASRTIYFMRPGQVHRLDLKAGSSGYIMQFKAGFYAPGDQSGRQVLRRAGTAGCFRPDAARYQELMMVLGRIHEEYERRQEGFVELVRAYLGVLFAELVLRASGATRPLRPEKAYAEERLEELLELIENRVHTTKQVSAYARLMHLSSFQLNAIAKSGTGRSCSELINEQIILEARRLLLATTEQVSQVADRLGYEDVSYFIRSFKRHTGQTPEAFRRASR